MWARSGSISNFVCVSLVASLLELLCGMLGLLGMIACLLRSLYHHILLFQRLLTYWSCGFLQSLFPSRWSLWSTLLLSVAVCRSWGFVVIPPVEMLPVRGTLFRVWGSSSVSGYSSLLFRPWVWSFVPNLMGLFCFAVGYFDG